MQTLLVPIEAETGVFAMDEPGDVMYLVEVGVVCSDDASSKDVSFSDQ